MTTNDFGSASGSFEIPPGRLLGAWQLQSSAGRLDRAPGRGVQAADLRGDGGGAVRRAAPEPVRPPCPDEARYYFGLPVSAGDVDWRVTREPVYPRWWFWWGRPPATQPEIVASGAADARRRRPLRGRLHARGRRARGRHRGHELPLPPRGRRHRRGRRDPLGEPRSSGSASWPWRRASTRRRPFLTGEATGRARPCAAATSTAPPGRAAAPGGWCELVQPDRGAAAGRRAGAAAARPTRTRSRTAGRPAAAALEPAAVDPRRSWPAGTRAARSATGTPGARRRRQRDPRAAGAGAGRLPPGLHHRGRLRRHLPHELARPGRGRPAAHAGRAGRAAAGRAVVGAGGRAPPACWSRSGLPDQRWCWRSSATARRTERRVLHSGRDAELIEIPVTRGRPRRLRRHPDRAARPPAHAPDRVGLRAVGRPRADVEFATFRDRSGPAAARPSG